MLSLLLALLACVPHPVGSTEVGVRTLNVAVWGRPGVEPEIYHSGVTAFFPPWIYAWTVYDAGLQNLTMARTAAGDDSVRFKTFDGNDINVDVIVAWRIEPTKAPYLVQFVGPDTATVEERLVRKVARSVIRDALNELRSEEFYDAGLRSRKAAEARDICNHYLRQEGVLVEEVLPKDYQFNPEYEQVINDKTVADQEAAKLRSEAEAARESMRRELEVARGEVNQTIEQARGESERSRLAADASYFTRQREAEALLAEAHARTEGLKAQARAMSGAGGRNMVKIKVAEALKGKPILFMPTGGTDLRTTNVNQLLQTYGLLAASGQAAPNP